MYAVILAGGGGTRLRPLSRADRPKPFLPLVDERTLLQHTVDRLPDDVTGVYVVAASRYADLVRSQVPAIDVIEEPQGRNTAAALALATLAIDRPEDEVMLVLPADHVIRREGAFRDVVRAAERLAAGRSPFGIDGPLVTVGVRPDRPATEYGYLIPRGPARREGGTTAHALQAFEEKPTPERADALVRTPGVAWNAGMFLWQRGAIRQALARHTTLLATLGSAIADDVALADVYDGLRARSIDYEVMEPAAAEGRVLMASMDAGWTDIGGWTALLAELGLRASGRVVEAGETIALDADDLLVQPHEGGPGLEVVAGPGTIAVDSPSAHLVGAGAHRDAVGDLLARVAAAEGSAA